MAIYSLNLKSIGRTTHAAGTAGAHLRYIARPDAKPELVAEHMPTDPAQARTWMNQAEAGDRKNARVIDKVRIALPRELDDKQRMQLVQDFAVTLTKNRVPWFAAIHATGKDAHNPHCHLVIRDRDIETGKRVVRLSDSARDRSKSGLEPKAVEWVRTLWEDHANRALDAAGHDVRIDRRSLEAQGIEREPTIHVGPQACQVDNFVARPSSKIVETGNGRSIDYPMIDAGRTRQERNAEIVDFNLEKAVRSPDFRTRETARFEREQRAKDTALENRLIAEARRRTLEERRYKARMRSELAENGERKAIEQDTLKSALKEAWTRGRQSLKERHRAETEALSKDQGRFSSRFMCVVDITGRTRKRQEEEKKALQEKQKRDREQFLQRYRRTRDTQKEAIAGRYRDVRKEVMGRFAPNLRAMRSRHTDGEDQADRLRQARATERTQAEEQFEDRMKDMMKRQQTSTRRGPTLER